MLHCDVTTLLLFCISWNMLDFCTESRSGWGGSELDLELSL